MIRFCLALLLLTEVALAASDKFTDQQIDPDDILEQRGRDEEEFGNAAASDDDFDDLLLSQDNRPSVEPNEREVRRGARQRYGRNINFNLYVKYYMLSDWYTTYYRCCPKSQNFDCQSNQAQRLPCFYNKIGGTNEWCCPLTNISIKNCNCDKCVRRCPTNGCFDVGQCRRRYRLQTIYAVCYSSNGWDTYRRLEKYLASSCYCRASPSCTRP